MIIDDGKGSGKKAKVDVDNRLAVSSRAESIQHYISHEEEQAYQVLNVTPFTAGTTVACHFKNVSADKDMIITYIRHQVLNPSETLPSNADPETGEFFRIAFGRTYSSGGAETLPVNIFRGSGNLAEVEFHCGNPTLSGIAVEIDRWYTQSDTDMNVFNKEGSVVIGPNQTIELSYVSKGTGHLYSRLSFLMKGKTN